MRDFDVENTAKKIISFIHSVYVKEGYRDVFIAVSGGVDSATSLTLTVLAIGKEHVYPVLLPHRKLNDKDTKDARLVIKTLKIPNEHIITVDITSFVDSVIQYDVAMDEGRKGNVMARMRMVVLYDLSKKLNRLVVGTENKTEHLLGYYTRFGDEASDIEPIRTLYKTQVYKLAEYLKIPQRILSKSPSAGLWEGQTDEGEFGFSYTFADEILYLYEEKRWSKEKILAKGYERKSVEKVWRWIEKGAFKDRLPYSL